MDINLDYYKIFYYVTKHHSITQAAEELSLSQPAVSQAVKNLESALGCSLFVRLSKGVRLTHEGEVLYQYVERGYESILAGERKLTEILGLLDGEICIGDYIPEFCNKLFWSGNFHRVKGFVFKFLYTKKNNSAICICKGRVSFPYTLGQTANCLFCLYAVVFLIKFKAVKIQHIIFPFQT